MTVLQEHQASNPMKMPTEPQLADFLRYHSIKGEEMTSLKDYIGLYAREAKEHLLCHWVTAKLKTSILRSAGRRSEFCVLFMVDPLMSMLSNSSKNMKERPSCPATKEGLELEEDEDEKKSFSRPQGCLQAT
jgi:molecular chaperone HtpG